MTLTTAQRALFLVLIAVLLVSLTVGSRAVVKRDLVRSSSSDVMKGITVTDSAQVKVQPDTAYVTFGVVNKNRNVKNAARVNAAKTSSVIDVVIKAGIPESNIKMVDYSVEPSMDWSKNPAAITGYIASNSVRVKIKDIAKIGDLIDAAVAAGANNVQRISFDVDDKKKLQQKALTLAVKNAEGKAQAIAKAFRVQLGPATSASESVDVYYPESRNAVMVARKASAASTPITPGETTVSAQVKVVYSVR